jgi:aspartate kinase
MKPVMTIYSCNIKTFKLSHNMAIVIKFGGSSQILSRYPVILEVIKQACAKYDSVVVVMSAVQKTTNMIFDLINHKINIEKILFDHKQLASELEINIDEILEQFAKEYYSSDNSTTQQKIRLISYGELMATAILSNFLTKNLMIHRHEIATEFMKSTQTSDKIDPYCLQIWSDYYCEGLKLNKGDLIVTQGFVASTPDGKTCLMGRSGSDTTATVIANSIDAKLVEIWSDVSGIYSADPKLVPNSKIIPQISYSAIQEMAIMGSYVLHPQSVQPCQKKNIPILIKNTFCPHAKINTLINNDTKSSNNIYGISCRKNVTVITISTFDMSGSGFMANIYKIFADYNVSVDIVTSSENEITTTTQEISEHKLFLLLETLEKYDYKVSYINNCSVVSIIVDDAYTHPIIPHAHKLIKDCDQFAHLITHYSSNRKSLSFVVLNKITSFLLCHLHRYFIELDIETDNNPSIQSLQSSSAKS